VPLRVRASDCEIATFAELPPILAVPFSG
jgi:hypothetical protein